MPGVNVNDNDFAVAVQALAARHLEQMHCFAIDSAVLRGAAPALIQEVLAHLQCAVGENEHSVQQLMTTLEALAETSPLSARVLMATLWPVAGRLLLHDVCDAIDLWIVNQMSDDLRHRLQQMMESEHDEGSRSHLQGLLQNRS